MTSTKLQRLSRLLREELSRIIRRDINDPRLGMVSITDVEPAPDMRIAHIYISAYGTPEEQEASIDVLMRASRFLRGALGREVELRHTPELIFHLDKSLERGARVYELLKKVAPPPETPATEETAKEEEQTDDES